MISDAPTFLGSAYHPSLGDEPVEGRISFDRWQLRFHSSQLSLTIPLIKLQIQEDQTAGGRVCFADPERPDEIIVTFELHILDHPALREQPHTRSQIESLRGLDELKRRIKVTLLFLAGFVLLTIAASSCTRLMVRSLAARVPPDFERQLGEEAMADLQQEHTFAQDPKLMFRLTNSVAPLLAAVADNTRHYRFYILEEPSPNAFALPGGQVVVTSGLMDLAPGPDELAAVVAHETAHLTQRHVFRQIISSAGPYLVFRLFLGGRGGVLSLVGASSGLLIQQSFSQAYELEADSVGWDYLVAAHIDPRASIRMLRRLQAADRDRPPGLEPAAFSSHPPTEKRIHRLETKWRKFKGKSAFERPERAE